LLIELVLLGDIASLKQIQETSGGRIVNKIYTTFGHTRTTIEDAIFIYTYHPLPGARRFLLGQLWENGIQGARNKFASLFGARMGCVNQIIIDG
jgi:hypothetical protein